MSPSSTRASIDRFVHEHFRPSFNPSSHPTDRHTDSQPGRQTDRHTCSVMLASCLQRAHWFWVSVAQLLKHLSAHRKYLQTLLVLCLPSNLPYKPWTCPSRALHSSGMHPSCVGLGIVEATRIEKDPPFALRFRQPPPASSPATS